MVNHHTVGWSTALSLLVLVASTPGGAQFDPVRDSPSPDHDTALGENETAELWSDDEDVPRTPAATAYRELTGLTDVSYPAPPATAARWNEAAFEHLDGRDPNVSFVPAGATPRSAEYIADAHITVFDVDPATDVHQGNSTTRFIAPNGTIRAFIDYRISMPESGSAKNTTYALESHRVVETRLTVHGEPVAVDTGVQTPTFTFSELEGHPRLTVAATIEVTVSVAVRSESERCGDSHGERGRLESTPNTPDSPTSAWNHPRDLRLIVRGEHIDPKDGGRPDSLRTRTLNHEIEAANTTETNHSCERVVSVEYHEQRERLTVRDTVVARVHTPRVDATVGRTDEGTYRLRVESAGPWGGVGNDRARVRTRWRFYTASDPVWGRIERVGTDGSESVPSSVRPAVVHAFGSVIDPGSTEPSRLRLEDYTGPTLLPPDTSHEHVGMDRAPGPYTAARDVLLSTDEFGELTAYGLVRGTDRTVSMPPATAVRPIRSTITEATVVNEPKGGVTIEVQVLDRATGESIAEFLPLDALGSVDVAGHHVPLDSTGTGRIWFPEPGAYVATYRPPTEDETLTPFEPSTDTVRWHPLLATGGARTVVSIGAEVFVPACLVGLGLRYLWPSRKLDRERRW